MTKCLVCGFDETSTTEHEKEHEIAILLSKVPKELKKEVECVVDLMTEYQQLKVDNKYRLVKSIYQLYIDTKDYISINSGIISFIKKRYYKDPYKKEHYLLAIIRNKLNESKRAFEREQEHLDSLPPETI